jgi:hypothetical protein
VSPPKSIGSKLDGSYVKLGRYEPVEQGLFAAFDAFYVLRSRWSIPGLRAAESTKRKGGFCGRFGAH